MSGKVHIFGDNIEQTALDQFYSAMAQDFAVKGALMADAHTGYSLPIGAVVATDGVVVPSWVGYDIGCGMCAVATSFAKKAVTAASQKIFQQIYQTIPVGFDVNRKNVSSSLRIADLTERGQRVFHARKGFRCLGSLGSGNHFIEIGFDETERIWILIHSGSRGVGHGLATEYMRLAAPGNRASEGHFGFRVDAPQGQDYINDMQWAMAFALGNRRELMSRVIGVISTYCQGEMDEQTFINRNHNHAEQKKDWWIHRKGATQAEQGMMGVIPGNMLDGSFVVRGKGNPDALWSSSHGAGRVMGRKQAKRELDLKRFVKSMSDVTAKADKQTLDEAPEAYKDIFSVLNKQQSLVEICHHIKPMINIKG